MRKPKCTWTPEQDEFIRANYMEMPDWELGEALGRATEQVHGHRQVLGLTRGRILGKEKYRRHTLFTPEQEAFAREHNGEGTSQVLADMLNAEFGTAFTWKQIKCWRHNHKAPSGVDTRYRKGNIPWTAGKTIEEICHGDEEAMEAMKGTQFRKGDEPWNKVPVGTIVTNGYGYRWIKVSDDKDVAYPGLNWRAYHRWVWEEANGKVPEGMQVVFRNGDRTDVRLDNLCLMSNEERGHYKGLATDEPDMQELAIAIARVKAKVNEKRKRTADEEQDR